MVTSRKLTHGFVDTHYIQLLSFKKKCVHLQVTPELSSFQLLLSPEECVSPKSSPAYGQTLFGLGLQPADILRFEEPTLFHAKFPKECVRFPFEGSSTVEPNVQSITLP
ncbi:hypothetical protein J6590_067292 [Homalodisca vitripennis]|nr:hypothetical protein J6590_067292 [Homalodisca vitripennis]